MSSRTRTDFSTAIQKVLSTLESGEPYTLNKLAQDTKLNFRTVKKAIELLQESQKLLHDKVLETSSMDNLTLIRIKDKGGLALYPENVQRLILRTSYYPTASREEQVLTYLLLNNATNERSAIEMPEDKVVIELIEAEHIAKSEEGKYYLTSVGQMIAKGALKLYPELKDISHYLHSVEELVLEYEKSQGRDAKLASGAADLGYDIISVNRKDPKDVRYIEVKKVRDSKVSLTEYQKRFAEKMGDNYFLYVVSPPRKLMIVRNPSKLRMVEERTVNYQIPDLESKATPVTI